MKMTRNILNIILITLLMVSCGDPAKGDKQKPKHKSIGVNHDSTLMTGWYYIVDTSNCFKRQLGRDTIYYFIDPVPIITAGNIVKLEVYKNWKGEVALSMKFDEEGTELWSKATGKAISKQLAFILDNKLLSNPIISGQITDGTSAINNGIYTRQELEEFKKKIESESH